MQRWGEIALLSRQWYFFSLSFAFSNLYDSTKERRRTNHHHANKIYHVRLLFSLPSSVDCSSCRVYACNYFFSLARKFRSRKEKERSILFSFSSYRLLPYYSLVDCMYTIQTTKTYLRQR
jgi:hypothetical protein